MSMPLRRSLAALLVVVFSLPALAAALPVSARRVAVAPCASEGKTSAAQAKKLAALVRTAKTISAAHAKLVGEAASARPAVQKALRPHGAKLQSITAGTGPVVYDEYWVIMDAMPKGLTPEAYLGEMAVDLNKAVSSTAFNAINTFKRTKLDRNRGLPAVGDVYDIDIFGPDNGSVMLVEKGTSYFYFQTVTTKQTGTHPENGTREFGFQRQKNGAVRWYTRGASRPGMLLTGAIGKPLQTASWTAMLKGIGNRLAKRGGKLRANSFGHWIKKK